MNPTLELLQDLIARPSVTPEDAGCCELIATRLQALGFELEWLNHNGVTNLWATWGSGGKMLVLAGHTDVVPPGPLSQWASDPFKPEIRDGVLYGRGAADMKSGLAAMVTAAERWIAGGADPAAGQLAFLITSDEEGPCRDGTRHVAEILRGRGLHPDYAIVGEASSVASLGDRIMVGRRGSLGCNLRANGKQGHVAYPQLADNPIHRLTAALAELAATQWDAGNAHFPPTSFQISNFNAGTGASNVIPGHADAVFNFRYSTETDAEQLTQATTAVLDKHLPDHIADWWHSGEPFLTQDSPLISAALRVIAEQTGITPSCSTAGGTSDGRFLAPLGTAVIEIGPVNATIHKANECVLVESLEPLSRIYQAMMSELLGHA